MRILSKRNFIFLPGFCLFGILGTQAQETPKTNPTDSIVNNFIAENITFEPQEATVTINQDPRIQRLLDIKAKMDKDGEFSDRYRIQLYYGNLVKANEVEKAAKEAFPKWETDIKWETPNYKVWIGNYRTKLEADRALKEIKTVFVEAFSFKPEKN
ncbi:SPOR domain-containing protein [Aquimarina sp. MMG016]|uniref:SPOR domain-containing protein n=1 Tax=Aquimarina sp. MMG016 TaxID=2822690 RepID=UPI001B3A1F4D|nr:SPOR domain-containing protein [Aquimarina sp. MMG016]MBQ4818710.1 SPOR domain-containing protein [Aquimarina sp. MMG016]